MATRKLMPFVSRLGSTSSPTFANLTVSALTSGTIPKASTAGLLANSRIKDTGTLAGVGTSGAPAYPWEVNASSNTSQFMLIQNLTDGATAAAGVAAMASDSSFVSFKKYSPTAGGNGELRCTSGMLNLLMGSTQVAYWDTSGNYYPGEGVNFVLGTATGTKIGTATGQKLGFWNATPVVQQVLATGAGASTDNVITLLQTLGLCKQS